MQDKPSYQDEEIAKIMRWLISNNLYVRIPIRGPIIIVKEN